jgi:hypothetical protein
MSRMPTMGFSEKSSNHPLTVDGGGHTKKTTICSGIKPTIIRADIAPILFRRFQSVETFLLIIEQRHS